MQLVDVSLIFPVENRSHQLQEVPVSSTGGLIITGDTPQRSASLRIQRRFAGTAVFTLFRHSGDLTLVIKKESSFASDCEEVVESVRKCQISDLNADHTTALTVFIPTRRICLSDKS